MDVFSGQSNIRFLVGRHHFFSIGEKSVFKTMRKEVKFGLFSAVETCYAASTGKRSNNAKRGKMLSCVSRDWPLGVLLVGISRERYF